MSGRKEVSLRQYIYYLFTQQSISTPKHRSLPMIISGNPGAVIIILLVILLVGSYAHFRDVSISIDVVHQRKPSPPCSRSIFLCIQPTVFHPENHGISKHAGAGSLRPESGFIDQLVPHAVGSLISLEVLHHLSVALHNTGTVAIILGQSQKQLGYACCHPSVASCPEIRYIFCMTE